MLCLDQPERLNLQGDYFGQDNRNILQIVAAKCTRNIACSTDKTLDQIDAWLSNRRVNIAINDMTYEPEIYDSSETI